MAHSPFKVCNQLGSREAQTEVHCRSYQQRFNNNKGCTLYRIYCRHNILYADGIGNSGLLNNNNKLLGVITSQSIVDLVDDEMGEDYAKFAGLTAEEDLKEPLKESLKKRLPWLLVLLALGMVVSSVVGLFEQVVSQLTLIMCFQSLILDMAGNVGTQSLAVTIRVLMDESLTGKQKLELVWKEMRIAFSNGLILGVLSFTAIGLYIVVAKGKPFAFAYAVSGCIGAALLLAMVISGAVGTCIPLFFKKINVDPAVASGPLITTVNDLVAVVSYYGLKQKACEYNILAHCCI